VVLAVDEGGAVLAQYAGSPQRARVEGSECHLTQAVDSFSVPATRGLGRRGTFVETGERFAALFGGPLGRGDPWMWGFPVPSARRVGERFLGYRPLRSQPLLELDARRALPPGGRAAPVAWAELDEFRGALEALGEGQARGVGALAARGAEELAWRYGRHPSHTYELALCGRDDGELTGLAVYRSAHFQGRRVGLLCDGLFDGHSAPALVRWAAACARRDGVPALVTLLAPWCAAFGDLQQLGFRVRSSPLMLVGRSYEPALPADFWARRWYTTLGDSDLC
jgi:hypothetical protein